LEDTVQKSRGLCVPECGILEGVAFPLRNEIRLGGFVQLTKARGVHSPRH